MPSENYVISLQKVYDNKPRTKRANNAIAVIYDFFKKHTRKERKDVIIAKEVNEYIWKRSIQKPPRKVEVSIKIENEKVYVFLKDSKAFKEFGVEKKAKEQKSKKEETKAKPKEETKQEEAIKPKKTTVKPKENAKQKEDLPVKENKTSKEKQPEVSKKEENAQKE